MRVLVTLGCLAATVAAAAAPAATLDYDRRVDAHRAIERVLWQKRIWPESNSGPKPALEAVLPESALRARVDDVLRKSNALTAVWKRRIGNAELQAELDRMIAGSRDPAMLEEMFDALDHDPVLIAEAIARPALVDRLMLSWYETDTRFQGVAFETWWEAERASQPKALAQPADTEPALVLHERSSLLAPSCADDTWVPTSYMPRERAWPASVWTGTEMIVWGGGVLEGQSLLVLNTGARYNPATDTWSNVSLIGAPPRGSNVAAIWTGTRMLIWVGGSGGRYDPVTDTWAPISPVNAPSYTDRHPVWTGSQMIVMDQTPTFYVPIPGSRYDPASDSWSPVTTVGAPFPTVDGRGRGVWTGSSMVFWPGGRYDPVADAWSPISTVGAPSERGDHAMVWTGSRVIVWGGNGAAWLGDGGIYDPVTDTWAPMSAIGAPEARDRFVFVWLANRLIVWGGHNGNFGGTDYMQTGGRYDPATNTWTPTSTTNAPAGRMEFTAVTTGSKMIVWGGFGPFPLYFNTGGVYDPASDSWVPTRAGPPSPAARREHSAVWTGAEMVLWGGANDLPVLGDGYRYVPATDTWSRLSGSAAPPARRAQTTVWTGTEMFVWGGLEADDFGGTDYAFHGGRYNPTTDTWLDITANSPAPEPRVDHTAVWTGSRMIVWGGRNWNGELADGGVYNPSINDWSPTSPAGAPAARASHSAVWTGSSMVVWGGAGNLYHATGGRYDPATNSWSPTAMANVPLGRRSHVAVWTGSRMLVWGGWNAGALATGSSYDPAGDSWSPLPAAGAPQARSDAKAVWTGNEMIVWGGGDGASVFDSGGRYFPAGGTWRPTSLVAAPRPRVFHTAVWSGAKMIVWGGSTTGGTYNDGGSYCSCVTWYPDADSDGYGATASGMSVCDGSYPAGSIVQAGDCNDGNAAIHPGVADATCDGADDDCDGQLNEDYLAQPSVCGLGVCRAFGSLDCVNGQIVNSCVPLAPNAAIDNTCNNLDDDCSGAVDEDFPRFDDYWIATANAPAARTNHTAVWSGSEMIVFGGDNGSGTVQTGGYAYAPGTDAWRALAAGPAKRWHHTAVWTGSRMVVWGGDDNTATIYNTGSRYDPVANTWLATATTGAPTARGLHSAVWTGSQMIVWGGRDATTVFNTGAKYDPSANTWSATTTTGAPAARTSHTAVWTGSEMIVWGGRNASNAAVNTGSRYNAASNTWSAVTTTGAPSARYGHVAVWTGTSMIVWGGTTDGVNYLADGARYDPATNTWSSIPSAGAPSRRAYASFGWTGSELIVWGGMYRTNETPDAPLADGARYNAASNAWVATTSPQIAPPSARARSQAVWTGDELIVWGGDPLGSAQSTGGRYKPRTLCGVGGCQQVGLTYCSGGVVGFQCTPLPAVTEQCDNVDNDCDGSIDEGIPVPSTHPGVFATKLPETTTYWWVATPDTTGYDIVRGSLTTLRATSGNFTSAVDSCLGNDLRAEAVQDNATPGSGNAFWYLVRPVNLCTGNGTYDDGAPTRDTEIAASGAACP